MEVSIHDMQNFAEKMSSSDFSISSEVGNVINLGGDADDDLGMSLLANTRVMPRSSEGSGGESSNTTQGGTPSSNTNQGGVSTGSADSMD